MRPIYLQQGIIGAPSADAGAEVQQEIKDVGGGKLIASVKDADGNVIGLIQAA